MYENKKLFNIILSPNKTAQDDSKSFDNILAIYCFITNFLKAKNYRKDVTLLLNISSCKCCLNFNNRNFLKLRAI